MRFVSLCLLAFMLAACATTPRQSSRDAGLSTSLSVCPGARISNAPATDANRRIANYSARARIRGAMLLRAPVNGCVSSGFGPRRGGAGSFHHGVDLYTGSPAPVYAGGDGVVESVSSQRGYGRTVVIRHGAGLKTRYAHLSRYARGLKRGMRVGLGDYIGHTGESGNATAVHLHYEIIDNGRTRNPLTVGE
ncbi:MAG: M23 family metallopeptidase [Hyphococcus sp.]